LLFSNKQRPSSMFRWMILLLSNFLYRATTGYISFLTLLPFYVVWLSRLCLCLGFFPCICIANFHHMKRFLICFNWIIFLRPCLDVVGFTSIHMCWSGLEWNLVQVLLQSTPTHMDWCESDYIQTRPEGFWGFQLSPYAGVHECGIGGTVICYSRNLSIFFNEFLTMFFSQNTTYRKVVLVWLLDFLSTIPPDCSGCLW